MTNRNTQRNLLLASLISALLISCMIGSNPDSISNQNTPTNQQGNFIPAAGTEDYVDSDASDVDISPDFGTHSSFVNQQAGPDAAYDSLLEENTAPPPIDSENDVDNDNSDIDSSPDVGTEGTFSNAQGAVLDSSYLNLQEDTVSLGYGGELGSVFVTGSVPDMADAGHDSRYQAIFWNPSDDIYEVTRVEFNYTGSQWAKFISQGAGLSFPSSGWTVVDRMVVYWTGATPIYVQPHDICPFHIIVEANRINLDFNIDIRVTANGSVFTASNPTEVGNGDYPAALLWLGNSLPPEQNHSVAVSTETTVYVTLEEDAGEIQIDTGGTLTIDVPADFTNIMDIGGTGWGTATITGNRIEVSNTATVQDSYITYAFNVTAPISPGLYMLNIAYDGTSGGQPYAHPIGNFTLHVVGDQPTSEQIDVEYQWTTADYDEANEQLCIYVATHTGSEDLMINFWNGSGWENIGSITSTGWTNLTITGLTSATYTIQLLGGSEASDSSKDVWDVDLILLHVWSLQTYNYELDLEVQWTSAIYTDTNEELCIYAGSFNAESIRVDVWTGSDWTNVLADLIENSWNNVSVGTWLTSELFTVRFRGDLETGDTFQSSWQIDCSLLSTWSNEVPLNDAMPTISNLDDSSYMYAMNRKYQVAAYVADGDGYADIDYLELTLTSDDQLTEFWTIRYDEDTGLFTEQSDPNNYISLDGAASSSVTSGNSLNATFHLAINWNHPDISNSDAKCYVTDDDTSSSLDYYEVDWNVESRLDMVVAPVLDDGSGTPARGDTDGSIDASGTVTYLGSRLYPLASEVDIWISASEYGSQVGPWEATNYEASGGTFSVQVYADDIVGQDTFGFKAVEEGTGSGGLDQFNSSESVQYIADRVQVQVYASDDSRLNIGATASVHVTLYYDYDDSIVVDGTVTVNGLAATYSGLNGVWDYTDTKPTVQMVTYNTVTFSGGVHGITVEDQNGQSLVQIWDRIQVVSYSVSDNRLNVNTTANIDVLLRYQYDSTAVVDGLVTVNGISATHQGAGVWRIADIKSTVQIVTYNVVAASGNALGISSVNQNGQSQSMIWDQITVLSYLVIDDRVNLSDSVNIDVTLRYEYDSSLVTDGVVVINSVSATHQGSGVWRIVDSRSTVQGVNYTNVVCSGNTHGITDVNQNSQFEFVIWDQVVVRSYTVSDDRVNFDDSVNIDVAIEYEYDDTPVLTGFVEVNSISATHQGSGVWRIIESRSSVQSQTYDTVSCSGNIHGLTSVNQDLKSQTVIWDQITVRSYTVIDSRVDVGTSVNIDATIEYEYDDTPVIDGTATINSLSATSLGGGIWRITDSSASVVGTTYDTVACAGNTHGISSIDQNGESVLVIWDRIIVASYSVLDNRVGINTAVDVNVTLQYEYDSSPVIDGTVAINSVSASHLVSGVWRITESKSSVIGFTYDTVGCSGNLHGIAIVNQNSQSQMVIWDRIIVLSYTVNDSRVNLSTSVDIDVTIQYEYDSSAVVDGTVTINLVSATHQGSGVWRIVELYGSVQGQTYNNISCSGNILGISIVNQNGQSQLVIWDQITVRSYEVSDARDNLGDTITVTVELEYEYDDTDVTDGTVTINLVAFTYTGSLGKWSADRSQSTVMDETYDTVLATGNTHGITIVDQNGQSQVIVWDRIQVLTTTVNDDRLGVGSSCEIRVTLWLEYDSTFLGSGDTVTLDDTSMTWNSTNSWFTLSRQQAIVGEWAYFVNSSFHTSYGISVFDLNSQQTNVTWDRIIVLSYAILDNRVNVDDLVNVDVTLEYEFDDTPVIDGVVTINSVSAVHQGGGVWRITVAQSSVQSVNYDTSACSVNAHGISNVNQNGQSQLVIWDQITVRGYQVSDPRDDVGETIILTVELEYEYDDTDVVDGTVTINSISFTYTGSSGMWSANRTQSSVMDETYDTVVVAGNGHGISSVDQNGKSQVIVWDRIQVVSTTVDDDRLDIGTSCEIRVTLWLEYDSTFLGSGDSVTLDGIVMVWNASDSWFTLNRQKATVGSWTYFVNSSSQTTYGISALDLNAQAVSVIWDRIAVQDYTVSDSRVNLNDNVDVDVTLEYEYDSTQVTDGTVTINGASATHQGAGVWRAVESRGSVVSVTYNNVACSANTHGISIVNQNGTSQYVIWDEVAIRGYQVSDARNNIGETITITVELEYEYDDTDVVDGTVTINLVSFTYTGSSGMWSANRTQSSVMDETYDTVVVAGNGYDITTVNQNGHSQVIIWDRIQVITTTVNDGRINVGTSCEIRVTLWLEYDGTFLGSGDSVTLNGIGMTWNATYSWFVLERQELSIGNWTFWVNGSIETAYEISVLDLNSKSVSVVWDQITVRSYAVPDSRVNTNQIVNIDVTLEYEYDDTPVVDGTVTISSLAATHQGSGVWRIVETRSAVAGVTYNLVECTGNAHGITDVNQNGQSQQVIWDQVTIRGYQVSDQRDNVGDTITVTVEIEYEYDDTDVADGTVTINSISFTYTGSSGMWSADRTQSSVMDETYDTAVVAGNAYGITIVDQNGQFQVIIWDRIQVFTTTVDDGRINIGATCEVRVTLRLEYDGAFLGSGDSVNLDGTAMTWNASNSWFTLSSQRGAVGRWTFFVNASSQTAFGITALNLNSQQVEVIWDRIVILTTTVDDDRINVDTSVELRVTAELAYDGHTLQLGDTIVLDGNTMVWDSTNLRFNLTRSKSVVGIWSFQVQSALEATYGISIVDLDGHSQDVIWDRLSIYIQADSDLVANGVQVNFTMTVTYEYDSVTCNTYSIEIDRNASYWNTYTNGNVSLFNDSNTNSVYEYVASQVLAESTYGITVFTSNTETVDWGGVAPAPVNESAPSLKNPDNTDFMLAKIRFYTITSNVSDGQGYSDIDYVELSLWDNTRTMEIWRVRYTESTNAFTIQIGSAYIQLASWSYYAKSGNSLDVIWIVKIDWDHMDLADVDMKQLVIDGLSQSDTNWYESNWNVETRLDYSLGPSLSDDRGDIGTNDLQCNGTVVYYGSSLSPLANETDVWVIHDISGSWSTNVDSGGAFTIVSITSSANVRQNIYTIKVVENGTGLGGNDLFYTSSATLSFITDQIEFYLSGVEDSRIDVNDAGYVWWRARYDYDDAEIVSSLTAQLNGSKTLTWNSTYSRWQYQESVAIVSQIGYSMLSASESGYGLTVWKQTAANVSIIWDQIVVRSYSVSDSRVNINEFAGINVTLEYEYDDTPVIDGIVTINLVSATHQGSGIWRITETSSSVQNYTYDTVACSGNAHGITAVDQASQNMTIIWDKVTVRSYAVGDSRVNVDDLVTIDVTIEYEYDDTPVVDGSVEINSISASHQGAGVWRITQSRSSVQGILYNTVVTSGNALGITEVDQNGQSILVVWDQVIVQVISTSDDRVNIGDSVNISVTLLYEYDSTPVVDGTVTVNAVSATHIGAGVWRITEVRVTVQASIYNAITCSGNSEGITSVNVNGKSQQVIWDNIVIRSYAVSDAWVDINTVVSLNASIEYEYDDSPVSDGTVTINGVSATHLGSGIWVITPSRSTVVNVTYDIVVCLSNVHGITIVDQNSQFQSVIWDKITVRSYSVADVRVNINDNVNIDVSLEYEYEDAAVLDGIVTINGIGAMHLGGGVWRITQSSSSVQGIVYDLVASGGNALGLLEVDQNGQSQLVIWDRVMVQSCTASDNRVNVNDSVNVDVSLEYEYDSSPVIDGSVTINSISAVHTGGGVWRIIDSKPAIQAVSYDTVACSGNLYAITSVNQNGQSQQIIWDIVVVRPYSILDSHVDVLELVSINVTLEYDFDDTPLLDGLVTINSVSATHLGAGVWTISVSRSSIANVIYDTVECLGNAHGITIVDQNSQSQSVIWDKITVRSYSVVSDRVNVNESATVDVTIEYEYDDSPVVDGTVTIDGITALHQGSGVWRISQSKETVQDVTYSTVACSGNGYGISVVDQNGQSQTVIWDQVLVESIDVFDTRVSVNASVNIDVTLVYKYDATPVLDGSVNITGLSATHTGGGIWRLTDSKSSVQAVTYDMISCIGNEHGIASIDQNGQSVQVIWDQIIVRSLSADDSRVNVSDTVTIDFTLEYEYDDSPLIDGIVTLNALSAIHQGAGVWQITQMRTSVVGLTYDSVACVGNTYGITSVDQNSQSLIVIWDEIVVQSYIASDSRVNVNDLVDIDVSIEYGYDNSPVLDGTVNINGILATHQGGGLWRISQSKSTVQGATYDSVTCTGNTHGISTINQNGQSQLVVWDRVVVQSYSVLDDRVNIDENVNIDFTLVYDYDNSPVTDGTAAVNSVVATHQGGGLWRATDNKSAVQSFVYSSVSCSGNSHGITAVDQNGKSTQVIWDQVLVASYTVDDARINIGTSVVLNVTLRYKFDNTDVSDGVVIVNSLSATNLGDGIWQITELKSSVQSKTYQTVICSGNLHGITSVDQNSQQLTVIWDQIAVRGYSVTDDRVNINDAVSVNVTLEYEYDDTPVIDGVTTINGNAATHVGGGDWRILVSRSSVQLVTFDLVVCSSNQHGIDDVSQNLQQQEVIWDQVVVRFYLVLDDRVSVNVTVNVDVTLEYEYDDTDVTDGSVIVNGIAAVHLEGGIWRISVEESSVGDNLYDSVSVSGNYFGIVNVNQNGKSKQVVWDQVVVRLLTASDLRHNVGGTITVLTSLGYAYDNSNLTDGLVIINSITFSYSGSDGIWIANRVKSVVSDETFDSVLVSGNSEGISSVDQNGQQVTIIWDRIRILTTTATDSRIDIGSNSTIIVSSQLEYDGHPLGLGDTLFVNDTAMNWDSLNSWFSLNRSNSAAGLWTYYVNTTGAFESTFGISAINTMGLEQAVIWDKLVVTISSDASAVFDLIQVNFSIGVVFEYDGLSCTSYTLQIGRNLTSWKIIAFANLSMFIDSNMNVTYQYSILSVVAESTFGISAFVTNTMNVTWTIPSNYKPINASPPRLLNPDESDSLYSRYRFYMIETYLIDYNGFSDIEYIELGLWDNSRATEIWRVRFTFSNSSFSIVHGEQFIELAIWSTSIGLGPEANITWVIKTDWDHPDVQDVDVKQHVLDFSSASDTDWFESDWNFESRLDYSIAPSLSDDRGDPDTADLQGFGTVTYVGSSLHPLSNETDVWIVHDFSGTWSGDCNLAGIFSITGIGSSSDLRLNIYTFKIVEAGSGPAGTDLYYTLSATDSFITDRIEFYLSGVVDPRININSLDYVWWSARYAYDGLEIQGGLTAFLNGSKTLSWDNSATRWYYQETRASPRRVGYRVTGATESTYGLTTFSQMASDQSVIWDSLTVTITGPFDLRINVNTNASGVYATAVYNYDLSQYDGTLVINNTVFQYSTVQRQYYTVALAFGGTHNISIIAENDLAWCIWDQIEVVSINTNATYLDPDEYVRIQVYLRYDFDDADVDAGQFSLKFEDLQYVDDGIWECNITRHAFQSLLLDTLTTCNATGLGITSFVMNSVSRIVYWDRLEFYISSTVENRIDVGSTGFTFWRVRLESSGIDVTTGLISQITGSANLTYLNDYWQSSHIFHDVGQNTLAVEYAKLGGIDFFIQSASDVTLVWDRIIVLTTSATSVNPEIDEFIQIRATLAYEYDGAEVTDGVVSLWDEGGQIAMVYNSTGSFWYANLTKGEIGVYTFYVVAASGNAHGITVLVTGGNTVDVEFREPVLPRMTPLVLGTMVGGFSLLALLLAILVRRRYHVITPYVVTQILNAIEAIKSGEPVDVDVKPLQRMIFDELELGYIEAGLEAPGILFELEIPVAEDSEMEIVESVIPEEILFDDLEPVGLKLVGELESGEPIEDVPVPELDETGEIDVTLAVEEEEISHAEAEEPPEDIIESELEEPDLREPVEIEEPYKSEPDTEVDEEIVIPEQPELKESIEIAVETDIDVTAVSTDSSTLVEETAEQYVGLDASTTEVTSEEISRILEDPLVIEENIVERIPLTKSDWIEAMPQHIMQHFFEEELKELEIDELHQLSLMTHEEIESLVEATSEARGSDSFVPETSGADISDALGAQKDQFDEIMEDDQLFKTRMLQLIPAFIRKFFTDDLLLQLSREELEQMSRYSQPDLMAIQSHFSKEEDLDE